MIQKEYRADSERTHVVSDNAIDPVEEDKNEILLVWEKRWPGVLKVGGRMHTLACLNIDGVEELIDALQEWRDNEVREV